ncbi:hypothetical protein CTEN210_16705 [Chaetoceros tenuissimus]|uniref:Uncharacterized protein n=1 Tax=Chaetoceros tenuissimus TaxID=426638 RepID=A0AAD3HEI6_9STRA|nr:hypothetical protein CTEN210_16705 [Chaetoceros tenuissimus]
MHLLERILLLVAVSYASAKEWEMPADCKSDSDGGRLGYHEPAPTDTFLSNCNNPLKRELWRVFKKETGTAYIIPNPSGLGLVYNICDEYGGFGPMADQYIVKDANKYGLCNGDSSLVNDIDPDVALKFTTIFHRHTKFTNKNGAIDPWVPDDDVIAACDTLSKDSTAMNYCNDVKGKCSNGSCTEQIIIPDSDTVNILVQALNLIYGVKEVGESCSIKEWGATHQCPVAGCIEPPAGCNYSSQHYSITFLRDCCEKMCYMVDDLGNECDMNGPIPSDEVSDGATIGLSNGSDQPSNQNSTSGAFDLHRIKFFGIANLGLLLLVLF